MKTYAQGLYLDVELLSVLLHIIFFSPQCKYFVVIVFHCRSRNLGIKLRKEVKNNDFYEQNFFSLCV